MHIVLFYPRGKKLIPGQKDITHLAAVLPSIGLASIAAVLRQRGHRVTLLDAALENMVSNAVWVSRIISLRPDFLGFSANTPAFPDAYDVCQAVKEKNDAIKTIFGGVHVSWGKGQLLQQYSAIDYIVAGEGEYAFADIVDGTAPEKIPGVYCHGANTILQGPPQDKSNLCVMDDLPFPAYDLIQGFPKKYNLPLFQYPRHPGAHLISSRGCTYQCSYCDRSVFHKSFRWNSPEYTFELMKYLRTDFGIRHIYFYDDLFTLNRKRVERLCTLLEQSRPKITFNCIVRIGHIDSDLISLLKRGGCWLVNVGIESGDQSILDSHKEGLRLEDIRRDIEKLHRSGIYVKGLFMMGFPGETEASIQKTIDFACSLPLKDANITAFTPYPGAPITKTIHELGEFKEDWEKMDCMHFVFRPNEIASFELLEKYYKQFISRFYSRRFLRPIYRKMLFEAPHSYWRLLKHAGTFLTYSRSIKK